MNKLEATSKLISKEMLENTHMPRVTIEQAKLILVYQALRDNNWNRRLACESIMMADRTFRLYLNLLFKTGYVKRLKVKTKRK